MRTYWNTKKSDLLKLLEQDEKAFKKDQEYRKQVQDKIQANSKWGALIKHIANILIWDDESEKLSEMETAAGTVYIIYPAELAGQITVDLVRKTNV